MAKLYRSREINVTAADTRTQLTTLGSQTAPGSLTVPADATHLVAMHVVAVADHAAAESGAFIVRLEGPGIPGGDFVCAAGGSGAAVATGGHGTLPATRIPVGIPVKATEEIIIVAEQLGTDLGTSTVGVTLEFGTEVGPEGETKGEITVEGEVTAIDTLTRLTTQGSVAAPTRRTPADATMLKRLVVAVGSDGLAAGQAAVFVRLGGDAVKGGEQTIMVAGVGSQTVQAGSDAAPLIMAPIVIDNVDIEVRGNETLDIAVEMAGTDVGDVTAAVTAVFA